MKCRRRERRGHDWSAGREQHQGAERRKRNNVVIRNRQCGREGRTLVVRGLTRRAQRAREGGAGGRGSTRRQGGCVQSSAGAGVLWKRGARREGKQRGQMWKARGRKTTRHRAHGTCGQSERRGMAPAGRAALRRCRDWSSSWLASWARMAFAMATMSTPPGLGRWRGSSTGGGPGAARLHGLPGGRHARQQPGAWAGRGSRGR